MAARKLAACIPAILALAAATSVTPAPAAPAPEVAAPATPAPVTPAPMTPVPATPPYPRESLPPSVAAVMASGYLPQASRPDSRVLVPPPPAPGSAAQARDDAAAQAALAQKGGARWDLATRDAQLTIPHMTENFACALGVQLTAQTTPKILAVLSQATPDLAFSTFGAKTTYKRPRPFMVNGGPTCTPDQEALLRRDGSYPSGHSAIGWGWGLILAEIAPDRGDAVLARGRAFGQSRVMCNVHWQSDVDEGRTVAAATVARLHADPRFRADLDAARAEWQALARPPAAASCATEAETLAHG
jgi:acid phosphatase (class A)